MTSTLADAIFLMENDMALPEGIIGQWKIAAEMSTPAFLTR